ncbi:hypothetical protein MNBD_GAMMA01-79 [hydrothermal vent metagenome]|uniref:Glycosyltransferase RgtA/B/C/D-like domain-containing protein n=1 Tax=hydrothermal vent metagenome TaxID=652676 RepID=A0A3B0UZF4_9ZZZZ
MLLGDEQRYLDTGLAIAAGGDWHPSPLWPPMQSVLIALFAKIFTNPLLPLQIFQYSLLLLSGFILKDIVFRETNNKLAAQLALAIMILYPSWLAYSQYLWPEVIHVTLFVAIIWINRYQYHSYKWMLLSGFLLGLAILFKSLLLLFVPFLYLPLLLNLRLDKALLKMTLSILVATLVIAPAAIKAHKMTGSWMVSNSSMFNLWVGLNDNKRQSFTNDIAAPMYHTYMDSADTDAQRNLIAKDNAIEKIQRDGYINTLVNQLSKQYFRLFDYQSFFSQQFQGEKNDNYVNKYKHRYDEPLVAIVLVFNNIFYLFGLIAMSFGLIVSIKKSVIAQQFALFLLYTLALFALLHVKSRFRIPLQPLMAFYAGYLYCYLNSNNWSLTKFVENRKYVTLSVVSVIFITVLVFSAKLLDKYFPI